ncbi:MAG TPA: STAS domain-containing protein [Acidimicrobiales bacterium]|nr:STAS domain-containing protein [Acidimicrobiales bacterium]
MTLGTDRTTVPGYLDFAVSVSTADDVTVVAVSGDLDCYTAPKLRAVLLDLADGPRKVILDVASSDFIDSTGLGVVVGGLKRFRQQGGDMVVRSPSMMTSRLFEVTGVIKLFEVA